MPPLSLVLAVVILFISTIGTGGANVEFGSGSNNNIVNVLLLDSFSGALDTSKSLAAVQKAVEDVNLDPKILPDYSLKLLYNKNISVATECTYINISETTFFNALCNNYMEVIKCDENSGLTLASFFGAVLQFPFPLAVLGANSIEDAKLTAQISQYFHLNMLSFTPTCLAENIDLPSHFCMLPSKEHLLYSIAGFIKHFGWQRAAVVTENGYPFKLDSQQLLQRLQKAGVIMTEEVLIDPTISVAEMDDLLATDIHIFVLNTSPEVATTVLCEALEQGKRYPNYVWITLDWNPVQWWRNQTDTTCSQEQLADFIDGSISLSRYPTAQEYSSDPTSLYAYDAVWTVALALHKILPFTVNMQCTDIDQCGASVPFEDMVNCSRQRGEEIKSEIETLNFTGKSGEISFENGTRTLNHVNLLQYRRDADGVLKRIVVAHIIQLGGQLEYVDNESSSTLWPGGIPPDGTPLQVTNYVHISIVIIAYIGAVLVIIFAVVCCAFNFIFRKRKLIRLTSPHLNNVIICGIIVFTISIFGYVTLPDIPQSVFGTLCILRVWLPCLGYNLCFGTINVKMLRIYHIFHNPYPKKRVWKDWHLVIIILAFVIIDVITLTVVTALPIRSRPILIEDKETPSIVNERQVRVDYYVLICQAQASSRVLWLSVVYGYKVVLQIIALILAIKIRKVKISGLNDTKEVRRVIYVVSGVLFVLAIGYFALYRHINTFSSIITLGFLTGNTVVLGFIFIPKMMALYHDPRGEKVLAATNPTAELSCSLQMVKQSEVAEVKEKIMYGQGQPSSP